MTKEQRVVQVLEAYWNELRGDRPFPSDEEIDAEEIESIWEYCFLIQVDRSLPIEQQCKYVYIGKSTIEAYGDDFTGKTVYDTLMTPAGGDILERLNEVFEKQKPVVVESEFARDGDIVIKYRMCFMPLGKDGTVDHVIGAMRWKAF